MWLASTAHADWIQTLEAQLSVLVGLLEFLFEAVAVLCVATGLLLALKKLVRSLLRQRLENLALRLQLGTWLALALEFQLGADILATTIAPSFESLGKLGAIAAIRTFLNVFLQRELEKEGEKRRQRENRENSGERSDDNGD